MFDGNCAGRYVLSFNVGKISEYAYECENAYESSTKTR